MQPPDLLRVVSDISIRDNAFFEAQLKSCKCIDNSALVAEADEVDENDVAQVGADLPALLDLPVEFTGQSSLVMAEAPQSFFHSCSR